MWLTLPRLVMSILLALQILIIPQPAPVAQSYHVYLPALNVMTGHLIAYAQQGSIVYKTTDLYASRLDGTRIQLTNTPLIDEENPAWSPDGMRILYNTATSINVLTLADSSVITLTSALDGERVSQPQWSPDGTHIVFTCGVSQESDICIMDSDGMNRTKFATAAAAETDPVWSPDGAHIAFVSAHDGATALYVMEADGSNPLPLTTSERTHVNSPSWSPDSSQILFTADSGISFINADGTHLRTSRYIGSTPSWSPDGILLAFLILTDFGFHEGLIIARVDEQGDPKQVLGVSARIPIYGPLAWRPLQTEPLVLPPQP